MANVAPQAKVLPQGSARGSGESGLGHREDRVRPRSGVDQRDRRTAISPWPSLGGVAAHVAHSRVSPGGHESLRNPLDQADRHGVSGNSGLNPTAGAPPPAWSGFRPLRVTDVMTESDPVSSVILADPDASPLPN
jgi:hypothetical protein